MEQWVSWQSTQVTISPPLHLLIEPALATQLPLWDLPNITKASRSLNEEPIERVSGDAILGPTFKFVGFMTILIVGLTGAFLFSNGIIF